MKIVNPIKSKAHWKFLHLLNTRGAISNKKLEAMKKGVKFSSLPERVGAKMRKRSRKVKRRPHLRKKRHSIRKHHNMAVFGTGSARVEIPTAVMELAPVKKSLHLFRSGHLGVASMNKVIRKAKRALKKIKLPKKKNRRGKKRISAARRRQLLKYLRKARAARKHKSPRKKKHFKSGKKRISAARRRQLLKYLRKARAARKKKHYRVKKHRKLPKSRKLRRRLLARLVSRVHSVRPYARKKNIQAMLRRDMSRRVHSRGRKRARYSKLVRDAIFSTDYKNALHAQRIPGSSWGNRHRKILKMIARHPAHRRRVIAKHATRGWKEFAGTKPNLVTSLGSSPVSGTFNGVYLDVIVGTTMSSRRRVVIRPGKNHLYLIWSNGGRVFEIVGPAGSITELAQDFARVGEPVRLRRIDYIAPRYSIPTGMRRTAKNSRMFVSFTHRVTHQAYLTWNGQPGTKARFQIVIKGARGASLVNRSGIML